MKKENREILHSVIDLIEHAEAMEVKYLKALGKSPEKTAEDVTRDKIVQNALGCYFDSRIRPYTLPDTSLNFDVWLERVCSYVSPEDNLSKNEIKEFFRKDFERLYNESRDKDEVY